MRFSSLVHVREAVRTAAFEKHGEWEPIMTRSRVLLAILGCTLLLSFPAGAQVNGSITGTVRDNTQAVVPGAKVTITSPDKGIERSVPDASIHLGSGGKT